MKNKSRRIKLLHRLVKTEENRGDEKVFKHHSYHGITDLERDVDELQKNQISLMQILANLILIKYIAK